MKKGLLKKLKFLFILLGIIFFSSFISAVDVIDCGYLNSANTIYNLRNNVNSTITCFTVNATNVTLDLNGFEVVYGDQETFFASSYYGVSSNKNYTTVRNGTFRKGEASTTLSRVRRGVYFSGVLSGTISDINTLNGRGGVYLSASNNAVLTNITTNSNSLDGVYLSESHNAVLTNITVNSSEGNGIYLSESNNSRLTNIIANLNDQMGVRVYLSFNSTLTNMTANSNGYGITFYSDNNILTNVIANLNDQIGVHVQGNNNRLNNITTNSGNRFGVELQVANNNILTNITANSNSVYGIYFQVSAVNNTLTNAIANSNNYSGMYISGNVVNNTMTNVIANSNNHSGLFLNSAVSSNITNITTNSNNQHGIRFWNNSNNNIIKNSRIENNILFGLYFNVSSNDNRIYNNIINNSVNYYNETSVTNYFNTTLTTATNIVGENYIGGNYWGYPNWTGFSDICNDSEKDGLCDITDYSVDGVNYDYLPLSIPDRTPPAITINSPTNSSYTSASRIFDITATDIFGVTSCNYSLDGNSNITLNNSENDWTAINSSMLEGGHNVTFYCVDNKENLASSTQYFTVSIPLEDEGGSSGGSSTTQNYSMIPIEKSLTIIFGKVIAYEKMASVIDVSGIELTRTTIETNENVSSASITIKTINKILSSNLLVGLNQDNVYQGFQVKKIGLTEENLNEVLLEFKMEKSWLQGRDVSSITLQRKADNSTEWEMLNTTLMSEDAIYYYFKAVSSGFSVFAIYFDETLCTPGELFCSDNEIRLCQSTMDSLIVEYCEFGCSNGKCLEYWEPDEEESVVQRVAKLIFGTWLTFGSLVFMIIVAIILISLILVSFITYKYFERFGRTNKMRGVEY